MTEEERKLRIKRLDTIRTNIIMEHGDNPKFKDDIQPIVDALTDRICELCKED